MVLAEMGSTILGVVSTILELRRMMILLSFPFPVLYRGNMLLVLVHLLVGAIAGILPACVAASRAMWKMPESEDPVMQLPMN